MSKAWYRKYRPKDFSGYAGELGDRIKDRLGGGDRPQIVLLHGNYGCGKTTAARLLAGYYLCEDMEGKGEPCGECYGCKLVQVLVRDGRVAQDPDAIEEINGSTKSGVDDIRELVGKLKQLPTNTKYRVVILDECHRLTTDAQNAFLKLLEDTPKHVVIIMATTEKDAILKTVLSRCLVQWEVKRQTVSSMVGILLGIAKAEGLAVEKRALEVIARKGEMIPRNCITLLEDVAKTRGREIKRQDVLEYWEGMTSDVYLEYMKVAHKGLEDILKYIDEYKKENEVNYHKFVTGLAGFILEATQVRMGIVLEDHTTSYLKQVKTLFANYKVAEFGELLLTLDTAMTRGAKTIGTPDLALTTLALNIGKITSKSTDTKAANVEEAAKRENAAGGKKYVERDMEVRKRKEAEEREKLSEQSSGTVVDMFMKELGAVMCDSKGENK